jgi:hypothetical protein
MTEFSEPQLPRKLAETVSVGQTRVLALGVEFSVFATADATSAQAGVGLGESMANERILAMDALQLE